MSKFAHIIATPFTGVGLHGGYRGDQWFKHRVKIFKNFTLKSLLNQSNRNFIHWFWFRPEEEKNPLVRELAEYLSSIHYPFVFTFYGLMYVDDKFTNYNLKTKLRNFLMMSRDKWHHQSNANLRTIWRHTWENKNNSLPKRLAKALDVVKSTVSPDHDWVYLTRIDSDDMFHKNVIELIQDQTPDYRKALVFDKGYIYNVETGELASWEPPTNPPFHTIIFPGSVFFDPQVHLEYYKDFKSHEDITRVFNCTTLDVGKFMVTTHAKQISTAWESPLIKKVYHSLKYGTPQPFKSQEIGPRGYLYTVSGKNISTRWMSRTTKQKNPMIGQEIDASDLRKDILSQFGINYDENSSVK